MSISIKDLFDYDLDKRSSKCKTVCLRSIFYKNKKSKEGLDYQCKSCVIQKQKKRNVEKREQIKNVHWKIVIEILITKLNKIQTEMKLWLIFV